MHVNVECQVPGSLDYGATGLGPLELTASNGCGARQPDVADAKSPDEVPVTPTGGDEPPTGEGEPTTTIAPPSGRGPRAWIVETTKPDKQAIEGFLRELHPDCSGTCFEVRVLECGRGKKNQIIQETKYKKIFARWYQDPVVAVLDLQYLRGVSAFVGTNPIDIAYLAKTRSLGPMKSTTPDHGVVCFRNLLIDIDSVRPEGVSATDVELGRTLACRDRILDDLPELAAASIWGTSGNGALIVPRLPDLPNDATTADLLGKLLHRIACAYQADGVKIDVTTRNPSRVMSIPGTFKTNGAHSPDLGRPYRMAWIDGGWGRRDRPPLDVAALVDRLGPSPREVKVVSVVVPTGPLLSADRGKSTDDASDEDLINRARSNPFTGPKFEALFDRGEHGGDPSAGDMSLANLIARVVGADPACIERIFGASALGRREKWLDRLDYRALTIGKAIEGLAGSPAHSYPDVPMPGFHQPVDLSEDGDEFVRGDPSRAAVGEPDPHAADPHRQADQILTRYLHQGVSTLRYYGGEFLHWTTTKACYAAIPDHEMAAMIGKHLKAQFDRDWSCPRVIGWPGKLAIP